MYYNCSRANFNKENSTGVWDDNFVGVWHLNEPHSTSADHYKDSTINNNHGQLTDDDSDSASVAGKIANALDFNGDADGLACTDANNSLDCPDELTISLWVKPETLNNYKFLVAKQPSGAAPENYGGNYEFRLETGTYKMQLLHQKSEGTDYSTYTSTASVSAGQWQYLTVSLTEGGNVYFYKNGSAAGSAGQSGTFGILNDEPVRIADRKDHYSYFASVFDEVRISNIARNWSWINATFDSVNDTSSFIHFGKEVSENYAPVLSSPDPSDGGISDSLNPILSITVNDGNGDEMDVTFRTNASGSWEDIDTNSSVYNGTYSQTPSDMDSYSTPYWWSVNCTDGESWTNATYSFTTPTILSLYFNAGDNIITWARDSTSMFDGQTTTYAWTNSDGDVQYLIGNTCPGVPPSGTIVKVELRAYGYRSGLAAVGNILIRPVFTGETDGSNYVFTPSDTSAWSSYYEITNDDEAPEKFEWSDIQNLDCDIEAQTSGYTLYCAQVDIRVTYKPD